MSNNATTQTEINDSCNCCWRLGRKKITSGRMKDKTFMEIALRHPEYVQYISQYKGDRTGSFKEFYEFLVEMGLIGPDVFEEI